MAELNSAVNGRSSWMLEATIDKLRAPLGDQLGDPANPDPLVDTLLEGDEKAIFAGTPPERRGHGVAIPVNIMFAGSSKNRGDVDVTHVIQASVVADADWYDTWRSWGMNDCLDVIAEKFAEPWAQPNIKLLGGAGGSDAIQVDEETGERVIFGRWRFERHLSR